MPDPKKDLVRILMAEAPGSEEAKIGEPLVGGSGRLLNKLLAKAGIDRDGLTLANCIQCQPPKNIFPTDPAGRSYISKADAQKSIEHCKNAHVAPLLASRKWHRVDLLGGKALNIIGGVTGSVDTWRGSPLAIPGGLRGIATYHPSYLMRDQSMLPVAVNDLMKSLDEPPEYYSPWPTLEEVKAFEFKRFAFDIECPQYKTLGPDAPAEMVGLCARPGFAMCVPIKGEYKNELKRIFSLATEVIGHNSIQFDLPRLQKVGIEVNKECKLHDTMLQQHLLFPDLSHDLQFVGSQFISKPAWKEDKSRGWEPYCCRDTDVTFQCWQQLYPMLRKEKLEDLYWDVQVPLAKICHLMEETGFKTDPNRIGIVREKLLKELEIEEQRLPEHLRTHSITVNKRHPAPAGTLGKAGKPVKYILLPEFEKVTPWRSPELKKQYLYGSVESGGLGAETILDAKSGNITTGKIALDKIYTRTKNPAVRALRRLNQLDETITTFAKEEMAKVERVHPHFNVQGTACLAPFTRVCTSDLRWVLLENIKVNDVLIGFDEEGTWRKLKPSIVKEVNTHFLESFKISVGGTEIIASEDHGWLVETSIRPKGQGRFKWVHTRDLRRGDRLAAWHEPWVFNTSRDAGYLSGIIDGEGCQNIAGSLYITQKENACLEEVRACLKREQIPFTDMDTKDRAKPEIKALYVPDGIGVIGSLRPARLIAKCQRTWEDKTPYNKKKIYATIDSIEPLGKRVVIGLKTTTETFIAEGFLSHNSGRLSSSDPNLQNIPESARVIYVPSHPDWEILSVDFSGIENILTAWFAEDKERLDRLLVPGFSEHKRATELFFGIPYDEVIKDNTKDAPYHKAKTIVHGTDGAMGYKRIAYIDDMDLKEARELQDKWKKAIWPTIQWQMKIGSEAQTKGVLVNPFGRKRWFYTSSAYTEGVRTPAQSTAADILFRCMIGLIYTRINLDESLAEKVSPILGPLPWPARLLLSVHDELVIEAPKNIMDRVIDTVKRVMNQPWAQLNGLQIPVGIKTGPSWGELE